MLVVHSDYRMNVVNLRALGSAFLIRIQGHLYVQCSKNFIDIYHCTSRTKKKVNQKYKFKKRITYRPSPATTLKFDWG